MEYAPVPRVLADPAHAAGQYLVAQLQGESFGMDIDVVREIIAYSPPTPIPMMPDFVLGVINLRGQVVPVIDMARRFGKAPTEVQKRSCVIIVDLQTPTCRQRLGVVVDAVNAVQEFLSTEVEAPPQFGSGLRTDFICAMGRLGDRFIILLNLARVLSVEEMSSLVNLTADTVS